MLLADTVKVPALPVVFKPVTDKLANLATGTVPAFKLLAFLKNAASCPVAPNNSAIKLVFNVPLLIGILEAP